VTCRRCAGQRKKLNSSNHSDEIQCKNEECLKSFTPKTYNAIFCSPECRRVVTNKKLLDKYYENKERKNRKRVCQTKDCETILSSYNKEDICERCKRERYILRLVSWGWDENKLRDEYR
jgi:hypothetical protein